MKFVLFVFLLVIVEGKSTQKRHRRKVATTSNSSDVLNVDTKCHKCRTVVTDSTGYIPSLNQASDYFNELIYGWTIEVPMGHDILLTFSWQSENISFNETSTCERCKPYFEIIYGYSTSEATFKIDKFYDIRQLTKLNIPSYKTEIRFFSGVHCSESRSLENAGFTISFKAIPLEQTWSIYTLLSVLIPSSLIILGLAFFCVVMKKKQENIYEVPSLPIPICIDLNNPAGEFKKCQVKEKNENRGRGLRLRTQRSSRSEEPKVITVLSSLVDSEVSESSDRLEKMITPDASNLVPLEVTETKKQHFIKRLPPKVNLLNRYPRSTVSTPHCAGFHVEDSLSKSDIVLYERGKPSEKAGKEIFTFDVLPIAAQTELEKSVFLHSSSSSSDDILSDDSGHGLVSSK